MRFWIILISALLIAGCRQSGVPVSVQKGLDSIAIRWVPDEREGICSFKLKMLSKDLVLVKGETNLAEAKNVMMNYLAASGLRYADSLDVLPNLAEVKKPWGLVTVSVSNIKKLSSDASELVSQAIMGTPVKILKKKDDWLLVQTPDFYIGWVDESGICEMTDEQISAWKKSDRIIFTYKSGDIISETNSNEVVSDIIAGSIVQYEAEKGDYYIIKMPDGRPGRIEKKNAANFKQWCSSIKPQADNMAAFGKSILGSPYLWGGTSTKAPDCSGFVKTIYFNAGIILARDASLQFLHGQAVDISGSFSKLEPGDLLFFGHYTRGVKRITHVGFYLGDSELIHASGMVRINSLDSTRTDYSSHLKETILGARRIIGTRSERGIEHVSVHDWYNVIN
jgi:gamma-D-glutamyl-L-lysine dipeptidyl-peptidase